MKVLATKAIGPVGVRWTRARAFCALLVMIMLVLTAGAAWRVSATPGTRPAVAMSAECHQAYRGYMEASDPAEADFWAESWMTFGCETGAGYWA